MTQVKILCNHYYAIQNLYLRLMQTALKTNMDITNAMAQYLII
jgi:hypothetical protein